MNVTDTPSWSATSLRHCLNVMWRSAIVEDVGVAHVHFVLAESPLALGILDGDAGLLEMPPHRARVEFGARALQQVVILEVMAERLEIRIATLRRVAIGVTEGEVFEFRRSHHVVTRRFDLAAENRTWRDGNILQSQCTIAVFSSQLAIDSVAKSGTR